MSEEATMKVATLNVHGWEDAKNIDNLDRVISLVKKHDPDVLCLQETYIHEESQFQRQMNYKSCLMLNGCSILSKFNATEVFTKTDRKRDSKFARFVTAKIEIPDTETPIFVTCLHLDHRLEPRRLSQIDTIREVTSSLLENESAQIWTGDFNALTQEDYSSERWNEISSIRERNMWEIPQTELTTKVKKFGFVDCWTHAGKPKPIGTCRFDTRIDYIYATPSLLKTFSLKSVQHIEDNASDHNMVIATFNM